VKLNIRYNVVIFDDSYYLQHYLLSNSPITILEIINDFLDFRFKSKSIKLEIVRNLILLSNSVSIPFVHDISILFSTSEIDLFYPDKIPILTTSASKPFNIIIIDAAPFIYLIRKKDI
jgi:hypothetical protein